MVVNLESNLEVKHLKAAGIGNKFLILVEIARHPNGLSLPEIGPKFSYCTERTTQYHLGKLAVTNLVTKKYEKRNGGVEAVFCITPYGVDKIQTEMKCLCEIMSTVKKEMIGKAK